MIATDLDGTLLAGKSILPPENLAALRRAMAAGVRLVLCTGRMVESTLPLAHQIKVNAPMVLFNGAMIYDGDTDRILCGHTIPRDSARALLQTIEACGCYVQAFPGRGYFMQEATAWTDYYADKIGVSGQATGKPLSQWLDSDVYKLLCLGEGPAMTALMDKLKPLYPQLSFMKSSDTHLEIVSAGIDKASGLKDICGICDMGMDEVIAFGDEANDLPMILAAGEGYCMENAPAAIRKAARLIAPANTQCGVARIVDLYLNEGRMGG